MSADLDPATVTGTSSAAVEKATGKSWAEWMELLDAAGGHEMNHKAIVDYLARTYQVPPWWQQQVAVGYEQSRRLRAVHEMPDGYQISRSRTLAADIETVYAAWADETTRARWLPDASFTIRKATPHKTLRLTWADSTMVEVRLTDKGDRTQIAVQHSKLSDAAAAASMKEYWAEALGRLESSLTSKDRAKVGNE